MKYLKSTSWFIFYSKRNNGVILERVIFFPPSNRFCGSIFDPWRYSSETFRGNPAVLRKKRRELARNRRDLNTNNVNLKKKSPSYFFSIAIEYKRSVLIESTEYPSGVDRSQTARGNRRQTKFALMRYCVDFVGLPFSSVQSFLVSRYTYFRILLVFSTESRPPSTAVFTFSYAFRSRTPIALRFHAFETFVVRN